MSEHPSDQAGEPMFGTPEYYRRRSEGEPAGPMFGTAEYYTARREAQRPAAPFPEASPGAAPAIAARTDGLSSGSTGQVEMSVEGLRSFANRDLAALVGDGEILLRRFEDAYLGQASFSNCVPAAAWGRQVAAAHHVFAEAMRGAIADLDRFGDSLRRACENQQRAEDSVAEMMAQVIRRFDRADLATATRYEAAAAPRTPAPVAGPAASAAAPAGPEGLDERLGALE
ncbi:MAG: hypothetical protein ACT4PP_15870 [Sporichthyaceae bacterium]